MFVITQFYRNLFIYVYIVYYSETCIMGTAHNTVFKYFKVYESLLFRA